MKRPSEGLIVTAGVILALLLLASTSCQPAVSPESSHRASEIDESASSGVFGLVTRGPMCPGIPGSCPDEPIPDVPLEILDQDSAIMAQVTSDEEGRYRAVLPSGEFVITAKSTVPATWEDRHEHRFTVLEGQWTEIDIRIDTAVRGEAAPRPPID